MSRFSLLKPGILVEIRITRRHDLFDAYYASGGSISLQRLSGIVIDHMSAEDPRHPLHPYTDQCEDVIVILEDEEGLVYVEKTVLEDIRLNVCTFDEDGSRVIVRG